MNFWGVYNTSTVVRRDPMDKVHRLLGQWLAPNGQTYDHYRPEEIEK